MIDGFSTMMLVEDNWETIERDVEHTPFDKVLLALFLIVTGSVQ